MNGLIQDQTSLDPPTFPRDQPFISLWEHPVSLNILPLLLSFAVVFAILAGLWFVIASVRSRR